MKHINLPRYTVTVVTETIVEYEDSRESLADDSIRIIYGKPEKRVYRGVVLCEQNTIRHENTDYLNVYRVDGIQDTLRIVTVNNREIEIAMSLVISIEVQPE